MIAAFLGVFAAGWGVGKLPLFASATNAVASKPMEAGNGEIETSAVENSAGGATAEDSLSLSASARAAKSSGLAPDGRADLFDPQKRETAERYLREIPYSLLKLIFLERQDAEFEKSQERYPTGQGKTDEENDRRMEGLFGRFRENSQTFFFAGHADWKLRDGRTVEVETFAHFYSSRAEDIVKPIGMEKSTGELTSPKELCWYVSVYLKLGDRTASEGTSTCLAWTAVREGHPYAVLGNYQKSLTPYFDSISVPLPGFGDEGGANPEWYDSTKKKWTGLSPIRWENLEQTTYQQREKTLRDRSIVN
jgi:hypothetical protein